MISLYDTRSRTIRPFSPIVSGEVRMYHCGPTVYDYAHIGNFRSFIFADTIRRTFEYAGFRVRQVINITDVGHLVSDEDTGEDKLEIGAKREGKSAQEVAQFYTEAFLNDLKLLNVRTEKTLFPKATDHIPEQIALIETLKKKGFAYKTSDGMYLILPVFPAILILHDLISKECRRVRALKKILKSAVRLISHSGNSLQKMQNASKNGTRRGALVSPAGMLNVPQ